MTVQQCHRRRRIQILSTQSQKERQFLSFLLQSFTFCYYVASFYRFISSIRFPLFLFRLNGKSHGMVPLNGSFIRLLCKCLLLLSPVLLFLFWLTSKQNQSSVEVDQLERRLGFSLAQLDSLHTQIDVITRHKERIERLLEEEREHFAKKSKDQAKRVLHLEAENNRLSEINRQNTAELLNRSIADQKAVAFPVSIADEAIALVSRKNSKILYQTNVNGPFEQRLEDPFDGHQLHMPPLPKEDENPETKSVKKGEGEREDVGAEKDYIFAREKPRKDLVFRRANGNNGTSGQPFSKRELMKKMALKAKGGHNEKTDREEEEVEGGGREGLGVVKADG